MSAEETPTVYGDDEEFKEWKCSKYKDVNEKLLSYKLKGGGGWHHTDYVCP